MDLHGAHDLRHTFATRLEDSGIPARVNDAIQQRLAIVLRVAEQTLET